MARLIALKKKLNEILLENKLISEADLKRALQVQKEKGGQLSKILVEQKLVSQKQLMVCLGSQLGIPPINLNKYKIDPEVARLIPERVARHYLVMPISKIKNVISVAMVDPLNIFALDDIKALTRSEIQTMITTSDDILQAIEKIYGSKMLDMGELAKSAEENITLATEEAAKATDIEELTKVGEGPIIKLLNVLVSEGLKRRASDIHIEPYYDRVRVRYRIDGVLQEFSALPKKIQNALLTRLKIMSTLDITQKRLPQDGRFKVISGGKEIDFRVSVLPTSFGGKVVLRALDRSNLSIGLDNLGFLPGPLTAFKEAIAKPYGMILLTGPTG